MAGNSSVPGTVDPITSDALQLMQRFREKDSVQFNAFLASWHELNFPFIYWCGASTEQKEWVVDLLLMVGVQEMCKLGPTQDPDPHSDQTSSHSLIDSIAGLFLLYAIYFTQPCQPKVLIRVTHSNWERILSLHELMKVQRCVDADYALSRLRSCSAFLITCTNRRMCLSLEQGGGQGGYTHAPTGDRTLAPLIETVSGSMREYHDMKLQLSDYLPQHLLATPTMSDQMKEALESYKTSLQSLKERQQSS